MIESASPDPVSLNGRTSRTRVKSQRALESEHSERLLRRARVIPAQSSSSLKSDAKPQVTPKKKSSGVKERRLYCICRSDGLEGTPMIECGECNDW
jgi:hypothetical protein